MCFEYPPGFLKSDSQIGYICEICYLYGEIVIYLRPVRKQFQYGNLAYDIQKEFVYAFKNSVLGTQMNVGINNKFYIYIIKKYFVSL